MRLTFLGKETTGGQSPTLYATDRDTYIVQGWIVEETDILGLDRAEDETLVEVPARLFGYLERDGVSGGVTRLEPPIVLVKDNGNYIVQGTSVDDAEALSTMDMPGHETCVELPKARVRALVEGGM